MKNIEFYKTPEGDIMVRENTTLRTLDEGDKIIPTLLVTIKEFFPSAFNALSENYRNSHKNHTYYNFLMARRFLKCNFGEYDTTLDVDHMGKMNFEFVCCPLRGECKYEGIICAPKFNSALSKRELEVMNMAFEGQSDDEIASILFISLNTVNNHKKNSFKKLGIHSMAEFIRYANDHKLFK